MNPSREEKGLGHVPPLDEAGMQELTGQQRLWFFIAGQVLPKISSPYAAELKKETATGDTLVQAITLSDLAIVLTILNAAEVVKEAKKRWEEERAGKNNRKKKRKRNGASDSEEQRSDGEPPLAETHGGGAGAGGSSSAVSVNSGNSSASTIPTDADESTVTKKSGGGRRKKETEAQKNAEMANQYDKYKKFYSRCANILFNGCANAERVILQDNDKWFAGALEQTRRHDEYCKRKQGLLDKENVPATVEPNDRDKRRMKRVSKKNELVPGLNSMFGIVPV